MSSFILHNNVIYPKDQLPLTMISLEEWSFIYIEGVDSKKYLQDQLTIDINLLLRTNHALCAHCNFDGKVWSTMRLFYYKKGYAYIERKSVSDIQIKELQKYATFSKVVIQELHDICLIGLAGLNARSFLLDFFLNVPNKDSPVICDSNQTILWFSEPSERFLLILSSEYFLFLKKNINKKIFFNNSKQWLSLDMEAGFPVIDRQLSKRFIPQAINLEQLKAISFKKGCYYGQETIARIFFKNLNKRFLCLLTSIENISPKIGSFIEVFIENKWCKIGILLCIVHIKSKETWIQVVLDKTVNTNNLFRVSGFKNIFSIHKRIVL